MSQRLFFWGGGAIRRSVILRDAQDCFPYNCEVNTNIREAVAHSQRLSTTLRYLTGGNNYEILKFVRVMSQWTGTIVLETCLQLGWDATEWILPSTAVLSTGCYVYCAILHRDCRSYCAVINVAQYEYDWPSMGTWTVGLRADHCSSLKAECYEMSWIGYWTVSVTRLGRISWLPQHSTTSPGLRSKDSL